MGLMDDMERERRAAGERAAEGDRRAAERRAVAGRVWADFLAYCAEFARVAPGLGLAPSTGRERVGDRAVRVHPGGWVVGVAGQADRSFYVTTEGRPLRQVALKRGLFSGGTSHAGYAPLEADPAREVPFPFHLETRVLLGTAELARADIATLGGSLALPDPPRSDSPDPQFAKVLMLAMLTPGR
ncbi:MULTISPECIES: hypothetical protein [Kitasatospora]|uniref:Uncharacterized protein n=1 Tax=Kitasatospora setae (strain ATCC 33774 / DSM 43861 / JCM 3304 / KCC A-0304 / NBRC 14216 / KM-6054) TaxID=452652 RepID=E4N0F5_KITSK|nr:MULTISPECIES: hypothetical protein [Kitasatospora]BAJ31639.1 hypothetical protein KSE_58690 [Kitasatospora setae KM-6054]